MTYRKCDIYTLSKYNKDKLTYSEQGCEILLVTQAQWKKATQHDYMPNQQTNYAYA